MKLGSHNTMTYLKPKKWYMYPFQFLARCQSKTIEEQYNLGARWFDLRIAFDKRCNPYFKHGLMNYEGDVFAVLDYLSTKHDAVVRILLEKDSPLYYNFCQHLEEIYPSMMLCGGDRKSDWTRVYTFRNIPSYSMEECYSSMPSNPKWYGIFPKIYAKLHRKHRTDKDYLLVDFIQLWKN